MKFQIKLFIFVGLGLLSYFLFFQPSWSRNCPPARWELFDQFTQNFISEDGKVLDNNPALSELHVTSEGQSYAMFFALVTNQPILFEKLWGWTRNNLMQGSDSILPAWNWGKQKDGKYGVLDKNSASDADLWIAYSLMEAGRIWNRKDYTSSGKALLKTIEDKEVVDVPGLGPMLLPGQYGFVSSDPQVWEFNPSYVPLFHLRYMQSMNPSGQWAQMSLSTARLMKEASPKGIAPNWVAYRFNAYTKTGQFFIKPERGDLGSYDAIRVYLWAGVTNIQDGLRKDLLNSLWGLEPLIKSLGYPPEEVIVTQGTGDRISPYGFSAAVVPFLEAIGKDDLAQVQRARAKSMQLEALKKSKSKESPVLFYYDNILSLFGAGFDEKKYKFAKDGELELPWNQKSCELR